MKITLCVEENNIEFKESRSDIKAIYQIPHFDLRKQRKNKKSPPWNFYLPLSGKVPPLIKKIFNPPPFFDILAWISTSPPPL